MPLGVIGQALLGGLCVLYGLAPGWVMAHFLLSHGDPRRGRRAGLARARTSRPRAWSSERGLVLATRALLPLAGFVLFLGTVSTASGPHPGSSGHGGGRHAADASRAATR